jgi:hypothetical protein
MKLERWNVFPLVAGNWKSGTGRLSIRKLFADVKLTYIVDKKPH